MLLNGWIHKVNVNIKKIRPVADNIHTLVKCYLLLHQNELRAIQKLTKTWKIALSYYSLRESLKCLSSSLAFSTTSDSFKNEI